MDGRHAVRAVRADDGEIRHADVPGRPFLDQAHPLGAACHAGEARLDVVEQTSVDLEDDLDVAAGASRTTPAAIFPVPRGARCGWCRPASHAWRFQASSHPRCASSSKIGALVTVRGSRPGGDPHGQAAELRGGARPLRSVRASGRPVAPLWRWPPPSPRRRASQVLFMSRTSGPVTRPPGHRPPTSRPAPCSSPRQCPGRAPGARHRTRVPPRPPPRGR